jgi:hypothetical protein
MAGSLIKIDEEIVTSAVASVDLGGSDWDSSYDVYVITVNGYIPATDAADLRARVLESSTANSTANYDRAQKTLRADTTFGNASATNETYFDLSSAVGNDTGEQLNTIIYMFNANNSGEYTFLNMENTQLSHTALLIGVQGGAVFTSASAVNGLQFFPSTGNIDNGTFTLYGLKK